MPIKHVAHPLATKSEKQTTDKSFWQTHKQKIIISLIWGLLIAFYLWYKASNNLSTADSIRQLAELLTTSRLGAVIYIAIYAVRPLVLFPATLMTLLGGFLFGPVWGTLYVVLGSNASIIVAYYMGRFFSPAAVATEEGASFMQRYASRMRENSFEAILLMRLLFLPFDLVNYLSGFLKIDLKQFLLGSLVGSLPGTISFVLLGVSFGTLEALLQGEIQLNPWALGVSIFLIGGSIALSRVLRKRGTGA